MKLLFAFLILIHGLIHLMGPAKAWGLAELPQLTQPISKRLAVLWLLAALLFLVTGTALFVWPRGWWVLGALALAVSQAVILTSWRDAKFGTVANLIVLVGVVFGVLSQWPASFRAE